MFCDIRFFGELNGNLKCPNGEEHRQFRIDELAVLASTEIRSGKKVWKVTDATTLFVSVPEVDSVSNPNEWEAQASEVETQITQLVPTLSEDDFISQQSVLKTPWLKWYYKRPLKNTNALG